MKPGTYIKHFLYTYKGTAIFRYGIVITATLGKQPIIAEVLWSPHSNNKICYVEAIKLELIEIISEV
tara:strand:+ start:2093 stop:2293 length:201 start_codon:yes stop_codon:yes gene_type:complete